MELDLSSLASVRKFAADFKYLDLPLNINYCTLSFVRSNNAGTMATPFKLSEDNIELHFATNHLGHFLLTDLLLETMKSTSRERKTEGRIVNVSSLGHRYVTVKGFVMIKLTMNQDTTDIMLMDRPSLETYCMLMSLQDV
ncbi:hypothetical protein PRUPE_5G101700 [Prunus persica]|uniref:Uncharacterized protein n=1 Tax=Prunus persica TaxID=3760 RepID=A0A251P6E1_PRUPE|nr:hypothetical protein PRUPE_5G101700 [Prunus persica]